MIYKQLQKDLRNSVISDILIVNADLPPWKGGGGGVRNAFKFSICFQECIFRMGIQLIFLEECLNNFATACSLNCLITLYWPYQSLEEDKNSTAESTAKPLTQSVCPVKVFWHVPAFHILIVLSADPGQKTKTKQDLTVKINTS